MRELNEEKFLEMAKEIISLRSDYRDLMINHAHIVGNNKELYAARRIDHSTIAMLWKQNSKLSAENKRLKEALAFYADTDIYYFNHIIKNDSGDKAREVLGL